MEEGYQSTQRCPTGQVQPNEGQISCSDYALEGKIKTNNAAHTLCVDLSIVEVMFNKAVALSLAFIIAVIFLALAVATH